MRVPTCNRLDRGRPSVFTQMVGYLRARPDAVLLIALAGMVGFILFGGLTLALSALFEGTPA